ncbi:hypothetical protein C1646_765014 [Rhizophagus diaphanus]|nr:hypothetical protein C1646_765014 [Rhizophagus diaphanus] [Rhizophagus sp. MUCL 43196]
MPEIRFNCLVVPDNIPVREIICQNLITINIGTMNPFLLDVSLRLKIKKECAPCFDGIPIIEFVIHVVEISSNDLAIDNTIIFCLVVGENPYDNAFNVKVNKTKAISELRDAIKEKNTQAFTNVDSKDIKLWKEELEGGTEDEHIVIDRESGKECIRLVDDEDLPCITEAKKEDINQGIEDVMYGIVSTAVDWVIIKLVSSSSDNNSEGKVDVLLRLVRAN